MLETVYRSEATSCTCDRKWLERFREGVKDYQDDPKGWWLSTAHNLKIVAKVGELVGRHHQITH
jgi:hypothetical protein